VREIFGLNQLRKKRRNQTETQTLAVRGTYLTSMAGSAVIEDNALREGPQATAHLPLLVGSLACRLRSPPKGTAARRLDGGTLTLVGGITAGVFSLSISLSPCATVGEEAE
jgi:hypothetical protein